MEHVFRHSKESLTYKAGQMLGRSYLVQGYIGSGGFGDVYLVTHRFLGRQAMKIIELPSDASVDEAFSEARVLVDLNHPNIVRTYDADLIEDDRKSIPFLTMEFAEAGTLADVLAHGIRLSDEQVIDLARQLAAALAATHRRTPPLIHGDVKPTNVLVFGTKAKPTYKLSDYGLAKTLDPETRLARSGGTVAYAAPEIAWGIGDERADIYSLGVSLYRALTGIHPYAIQTPEALSKSKDIRSSFSAGRRTIKSPSRFLMRQSILSDLIMACLEYDLFSRIRNGGELLREIESIATGS